MLILELAWWHLWSRQPPSCWRMSDKCNISFWQTVPNFAHGSGILEGDVWSNCMGQWRTWPSSKIILEHLWFWQEPYTEVWDDQRKNEQGELPGNPTPRLQIFFSHWLEEPPTILGTEDKRGMVWEVQRFLWSTFLPLLITKRWTFPHHQVSKVLWSSQASLSCPSPWSLSYVLLEQTQFLLKVLILLPTSETFKYRRNFLSQAVINIDKESC